MRAHIADCHKRFTNEVVRAAGERADVLERAVLQAAGMVRLTVAFTAVSGRCAQDILEALRFLMIATRLESGCCGCSTWAEPDASVHYVEEWETEADMRRRVRSPRFTSLLAVVECARERPRVQFDFVTRTRGIDYVAEIRGETVS
jgi:quinol monooxygenase YgiN